MTSFKSIPYEDIMGFLGPDTTYENLWKSILQNPLQEIPVSVADFIICQIEKSFFPDIEY